MSSTCVDKDRIGGAGIMLTAVAADDVHIRQVGQVAATAGGKIGVNLNGGDASVGPDELSQDRRKIACAAADMDSVVALLELKRLDQRRQKAWLAVVQQPHLINRHEHVVIQMLWICIGSGPVETRVGLKDPPRSWSKVMLARHPGERPDNCRRSQMSRIGELFGITFT